MATPGPPPATAQGTERAGGLPAVLARLTEAARALPLPQAAEQLARADQRLATLTLEVAVVGEFKRGKSTLVNALLGVDVLPTGALPLTAVPTVLERGDPACLVRFADGRSERHGLDAVGRFVTEDANPGNRLGVAEVTVRLHAPLLDQGVRLVDTPGVGSVLAANTEATDSYLPNLDAAVLVVAADPPISDRERAFLERVAEHAVRLFVVLNKADYLRPGDLARTVAFTERVVRAVVPSWPGPVYALSARADVGDPAALTRFREDLRRFLGQGRAAAVADAARRTAGRALGDLHLALDLERRSAALPADELARRRALLGGTVRALADEAAADEALLAGAVARALDALDDVVAERQAELAAALDRATADAASAHPNLGAGALLEALQVERPALLERLGRPTIQAAVAAAEAAWHRAAEPVTQRGLARLERLRAEAAAAFDVPLPAFVPPELDLTGIRVTFTVPRVTMLTEQLAPVAWRLRGAGAARARAVDRARAGAAEEAEMLFGRLRGAVSGALSEATHRLTARLRRHEQTLAEELVTAIQRGGQLLTEADQVRAARQTQLDQIADLLHQAAASLEDDSEDGGSAQPGRP